VLVPLERLLARLRGGSSPRHDDLVRLGARFSAQPSRLAASAEERALAARLRAQKRALAEAFSGTTSCHGCARGEPEPKGHWDGGRCCGTRTDVVFTAAEVRALRAGGTRVRDLVPPAGNAAGCAFRGPRGCSLRPEDRPTICLVYACAELKAEVRQSPAAARIQSMRADLHATFETFLHAAGEPPDRMPPPTTLVER
jgi:hypothetical protein